MRLIDADRLYNTIIDEIDPISISMDGGEMCGMMRTIIAAEPTVPAVPLDRLCEFLADTLHTPAPCFNNEEICPRMDFGYCQLKDALDVKECWKKILTKWIKNG